MEGVNRVWKVVQQYNGQSIIPIIILIGILFLVVREKKNTNYLIVYLGVLLLTFNEVTYYLVLEIGRRYDLLPLSLDDTYGNYKCVCHNEVVRNDRQPEKKGFCGRNMCFMFCNDIGNQHATIFSISGEYLSNATEYGRRMRYY